MLAHHIEVFIGRKPRTEFRSALGMNEEEKMGIDVYDSDRIKTMVQQLAMMREELLEEVRTRVQQSRKRARNAKNDAALAKYRAGDFVLVARPRKPAKLVGVWTGP